MIEVSETARSEKPKRGDTYDLPIDESADGLHPNYSDYCRELDSRFSRRRETPNQLLPSVAEIDTVETSQCYRARVEMVVSEKRRVW